MRYHDGKALHKKGNRLRGRGGMERIQKKFSIATENENFSSHRGKTSTPWEKKSSLRGKPLQTQGATGKRSWKSKVLKWGEIDRMTPLELLRRLPLDRKD